jgi:hypothetical protein
LEIPINFFFLTISKVRFSSMFLTNNELQSHASVSYNIMTCSTVRTWVVFYTLTLDTMLLCISSTIYFPVNKVECHWSWSSGFASLAWPIIKIFLWTQLIYWWNLMFKISARIMWIQGPPDIEGILFVH